MASKCPHEMERAADEGVEATRRTRASRERRSDRSESGTLEGVDNTSAVILKMLMRTRAQSSCGALRASTTRAQSSWKTLMERAQLTSSMSDLYCAVELKEHAFIW